MSIGFFIFFTIRQPPAIRLSSYKGTRTPRMKTILALLLTKKSHYITGKNNIKQLITRMNTDTKKRARVGC